MCLRENQSLQRGMNFNVHGGHSVLLSSHRPGAPYEDVLEENETVLIYEGHDESRSSTVPYPKLVDQPLTTRTGRLTQNGLFHEAAQRFVRGEAQPSLVRVYEKIKDGIWSYNGQFQLLDSWSVTVRERRVMKFRLKIVEDNSLELDSSLIKSDPRRIIPSHIKLAVWKRDRGMCVKCGTTKDLHFDHILPFSKGGTSDSVENIQLLCMKHNIGKGAKIE